MNFAYADMPSGTEIAAFNSTTGFIAASPPHLLNQGGSGTAAIAIGASGLFHLVARNQASQDYIAQTIDFYIN